MILGSICNVTAAEIESYCPAQRVELAHYPATIAPPSGFEIVRAKCVDNSHLQAGSSLDVSCSHTGSWTGGAPLCECDTGYKPSTDAIKMCKG